MSWYIGMVTGEFRQNYGMDIYLHSGYKTAHLEAYATETSALVPQ